jgi:hypothetical protein
MKKEMKLPKPVETYVRAINASDAAAFQSNSPIRLLSKTWDERFAAFLRSKNGATAKAI